MIVENNIITNNFCIDFLKMFKGPTGLMIITKYDYIEYDYNES